MKKTVPLIVVVLGCAVLAGRLSSAEPPRQQPQHASSQGPHEAKIDGAANGKPGAAAKVEDYSVEEKLLHNKAIGSHASRNKNQKGSRTNPALPTPPLYRPKRATETGLRYNLPKGLPTKAATLRQPALGQSLRLANKQLPEDRSANSRLLPSPRPEVSPVPAPKVSALRPQTPVPAAIGGPALRSSRTTAAISGTSIHRRACNKDLQ